MDAGDHPEGASLGQLGHHVGLHVNVNLEGMTIGGVFCDSEQWVPGVVVGFGALGVSLGIKLDTPFGGGEPRRFHRESRGQDLVVIDDPARVRPLQLEDVSPGGVPQEIIDLYRAGKRVEAIKRYRALNGATLDEARAFFARV
jgi:hypothetical protein